jgi:predicted metal-dependent phosphotriesterase family hydrolase
MTVTGLVDPEILGPVDGHNHLWIAAVGGAEAGSPRLTEFDAILKEMSAFAAAGGGAIVDCQPDGCGRSGSHLMQLSQASGVKVVASTGFHRRRYYPPDWWLWEADPDKIGDHFMAEIERGLSETIDTPNPIRAGLLKCACEAAVRDTPAGALEAAALVGAQTGICVEVHTEQGADAIAILDFFTSRGVRPNQVILCHMDKAPDLSLHREIAQTGAGLEYDTFYRPKYHPESNVWPLIEAMVAHGYEASIVLATDMAVPSMWSQIGNGPGLVGFFTVIRARLLAMQLSSEATARLTGGNIARRLAGTREKATENGS